MINLNLYNKYRPNCFKNLHGQKIVKSLLVNTLKSNTFIQSYLFFGPHGTGKTSLARIFAKAINCKSLNGDDVCNTCESCKLINENSTLDIVEIDAASNNGVEFMRELVSNLQYLPLRLSKKIYIIDEAHSLSAQSWTALLKAIEEPPSHVVFLFLTTQIGKIMPTIYSRCQKFQFTYLSNQELIYLSKEILTTENKQVETRIIDRIVSLSKGSARELLTIYDQLFLQNEAVITPEIFERTFSLLSPQRLVEMAHLMFENKIEDSILFLNKVFQDGLNVKSVFEEIFNLILDIHIYTKTLKADLLKSYDESSIKGFLHYKLKCLPLLAFISDNLWKLEKDESARSFAKYIMLNIMDISQQNDLVPKIDLANKPLIATKDPVSVSAPIMDKPKKIDPIPDTKVESVPNTVSIEDTHQETLSLLDSMNEQEEVALIQEDKKPKKTVGIKHMFNTSTLHIFPEKISDFLNNTETIDYQDTILYTVLHADKEQTNETFNKILTFLRSETKNSYCHNLIGGFMQKYKVITTAYSCLIVFEDEQASNVFNKSLLKTEVKKELEEIIGAQKHWFALPHYLFTKYCEKRKGVKKDMYDPNKIFKLDKEGSFNEYLEILIKN